MSEDIYTDNSFGEQEELNSENEEYTFETFSEALAEDLGINASIEEVEETEEFEQEVISSEPKPFSPATSVVSDSNGVIGSGSANRVVKNSNKVEKEKEPLVAIHSTKNVTWSGVGKVYRGYNLVKESEADQWVTRNHIRLVSPEEFAKEYGK
jgi:hypothetical protein